VTDAPAVDALFARAVERFGRVDAVVHAAALLAYGTFDEVPADVFDRVVDTNVRGTTNVSRSALACFKETQRGSLVLIGSLLGDAVVPFLSPYVLSKWAVHGFAHVLQVEARRTPGIDVSLVLPAGIRTPIYAVAANYVGRQGRPPPPVYSPEKVARAILDVIDRPRRKKRVGVVNWVTAVAFRATPWLYDALVTPYMKTGGLARRTVEPHAGNVFRSLPHDEAGHRMHQGR
jgi:NAD(P)-dependent dehydrogenase (short-subunit alcohol dehydrogenase family)